MIKVTDILFEIRNGYGNAFDQQEILSNDNLIPLINLALNEISKYFTHDEDLITLKLTTDNLYKMPGNVKEIIDVSEFDKEEKEYKLINLNDKHSNYFLKNKTTLYVKAPITDTYLRIRVRTTNKQIDSSYFRDKVTVKVKNPNLVTENDKVIKLNNYSNIYEYSLDTLRDLKILLLDDNVNTIISYETILIEEDYFHTIDKKYSCYKQCIDNYERSINELRKYDKSKNIELNKEFNYTEWGYNNGDTTTYEPNGITGSNCINSSDNEDTLNINDDLTDVLNYSTEYLRNRYYSDTSNEHYKNTYNYSVDYERLKNYGLQLLQELNKAQLNYSLNRYRNYLDLPIEFKELILLFIAHKLHLTYNSNRNEYNSLYLQLFMQEVEKLKILGFKELPHIKTNKGYYI